MHVQRSLVGVLLAAILLVGFAGSGSAVSGGVFERLAANASPAQ
jgi:hypothetical protein